MAPSIHKLNRQVLTSLSLGEQDKEDVVYWQDKTHHQRLAAIEDTRRILYGERATAARLQRVFTVTQQA